MKEIVKSKTMIGFIVFILGITYMNGVQTNKMEAGQIEAQDTYITMNLK